MLSRRGVLLGGTMLAAAAAMSSVPFALRAQSARSPGEDGVAWLKANALPIATAEPGSAFDDLEPLREIIGNARIVSMGEATHGTREFFKLKHRLIEYCVAKLGFTIIALEAEYGATLAVNDYVLHGQGNALDVVTGMGFWIWDTEEVVALVEWVRAWNLAHERQVKFYGFDMQGSAASGLHLLAYLQRVSLHLAAVAEQNLAPLLSNSTFGEFHRMPAEVRERTFAQIETILDAFRTQRMDWVDQAGEHDWYMARQSAVVLDQYARSTLIEAAGDFKKGFTFRDRCMADNVRALLAAEGPGSKALLWAHNAHVQRTPAISDMPNMGSVLHAAFDDKHVVVGFAFNQGAFRAKGANFKLVDHVVGPAPEGFVDAVLALAGMPLLALDLTHLPADGPIARWMAKRPMQRLIGAVFAGDPNQHALPADPRSNFDILLFVESTTAARGNKRSVAVSTASGWNNEPTNLALASGDGIPTGWRPENYSLYPYLIAVADAQSPERGRAVRIARAGSPLPWGDGALTQSFPAARWRGRRLVFSAAMRAEAPRRGTGPRLVISVWPKRKAGSDAPFARPILIAQSDRPVRSQGWTHRSVAIDIPSSAERVEISLVVTGDSVGWFGDLELEATASALTSAHAKRAVKTDQPVSHRDLSIGPLPLGRQLRAGAA